MTSALRVAIGLGVLLVAPVAANAQGAGAISGFGGISITGSGSATPDLGGNLSYELMPGIDLVAEAGRVGNVLPTVADTLFSAANSGLRASAFYADGGVRFQMAPHSRVTPYAEATAGIARLNVTSSHLGPLTGALASTAIGLLGRTGPVAGAGGGLLLHAGPVVVDVGYRYKQFFPPDLLETALGLGQPLRTHQARIGFGVRF